MTEKIRLGIIITDREGGVLEELEIAVMPATISAGALRDALSFLVGYPLPPGAVGCVIQPKDEGQ